MRKIFFSFLKFFQFLKNFFEMFFNIFQIENLYKTYKTYISFQYIKYKFSISDFFNHQFINQNKLKYAMSTQNWPRRVRAQIGSFIFTIL